MGWVLIDDQAPRHEKLLKAGPAAAWLWVCGLAHCQAQLTNGVIPASVVRQLGVTPTSNFNRLCVRLVRAGLWKKVEGGYLVHDYLKYNKSREMVLAKLAEDAARKKRGRDMMSARTPLVPSHPIPSPYKKRARARMFEKTEDTKAEQLEKLKAWMAAHPEQGDKKNGH